jgi:parallel beta-helix repeat protein
LATGVRFEDCQNCVLAGLLIEDAEAGEHTVEGVEPMVRDGLLEFVRCRRVNVTGTQVLDATPNGIYLEDCSDTIISGCTILDDRQPQKMRAAVRWKGVGDGNMITQSRIGRGTETDIDCPQHVRLSGNLS